MENTTKSQSDRPDEDRTEGAFEDGKDEKLGQKSVSGGISNLVARISVTGIGILCMALLARRLSPADFGLLGKVTALTGIAVLMNDLGISMAVVQSKKISHQQMSALFWVNVMVTTVISCFLAISAFGIAKFYGDDRVFFITLVLAGSSFITGIGVLHRAVLERQLLFHRIAVINVIAAIASGGLAVVVANLIGYWALVVQAVALATCTTVGLWIATGFRPSFCLRGTGVREKLLMGGNFTLANIINYFARNADNVIIAKSIGEQAVGLYSKSYALLLMPLNQIATPLSRVAVPVLSRVQDDSKRYRELFCRGNAISMAIQIPITLFAIIAAPEIVLTVLGPDWEECIPLFYALTPAMYMSTTAPGSRWIILSLGETARYAKVVAICSITTILGFWVGVSYGAFGVACAFSTTTIICRIPTILYCLSLSPLRPGDFFPAMVTPTLLSAVAAAIGYLAGVGVSSISSDLHPVIALLTKAAVYLLCYVMLIRYSAVGKDMLTLIESRLPVRFRKMLRPLA